MKELVDAVVSWPTLVLVPVLFGFAPSALTRLISLAFSRNDPRRAEMRGELPAVPRWERLIWVAQQLEVAIVEGLGPRLRRALTGRVIDRWHLRSGGKFPRRIPVRTTTCLTCGWPEVTGDDWQMYRLNDPDDQIELALRQRRTSAPLPEGTRVAHIDWGPIYDDPTTHHIECGRCGKGFDAGPFPTRTVSQGRPRA